MRVLPIEGCCQPRERKMPRLPGGRIGGDLRQSRDPAKELNSREFDAIELQRRGARSPCGGQKREEIVSRETIVRVRLSEDPPAIGCGADTPAIKVDVKATRNVGQLDESRHNKPVEAK